MFRILSSLSVKSRVGKTSSRNSIFESSKVIIKSLSSYNQYSTSWAVRNIEQSSSTSPIFNKTAITTCDYIRKMNTQHQEIHRNYEEQHIRFVTSEHGTSILEVLLVLYSMSLLPLLSALLLPWIVPSTYSQYAKHFPQFLTFSRIIVEYPIVMLTPLFIITVFAGGDDQDESYNSQVNRRSRNIKQMYGIHSEDIEEEPVQNFMKFTPCVAAALTFMCVSILVINHSITKPIWLGFSKHWNKIKNHEVQWLSTKYLLEEEKEHQKLKKTGETSRTPRLGNESNSSVKLPFITNYRGLVTYVTVISIIAVDFSIFPRRFCKTKLYGFSLMDIGTGTFVFANGIVSSEARNMKSNLRKSLMSSVPLLVLGFIRLFTVKGLEYHEVVEEYGVHWNFFFTLATVKILSALVFSIVPVSISIKAAIALACIYEIALVLFDIQSKYILNTNIPRNQSLIAANREGIFSTIGYTVIYLASIYVGQIIYNYKCERRTIYDWCAYAIQTAVQIIVLWILTYTSVNYGNSSCRRVANLSYILWILATNFTLLWLCLVLHLVQIICQKIGLLHGPLLYFELCAKSENAKKKSNNIPQSFQPLSDPSEDDDSIEDEDDEALESIEEKLNEIQQKLNHQQEMVEEKQQAVEGLKQFTEQLQAELENVTEQWNYELKKKLEQQKKKKKPEKDLQTKDTLVQLPDLTKSPVTLEAICYNGLFVFLLGNLLTGLINMSMYTIYVPTLVSIFILWGYASSIVLISVTLYWFQIPLKFW